MPFSMVAARFKTPQKMGIFGAFIFFVFLADAMMSYLAPVYIESRVPSTLILGFIISFSSVVGLITDVSLSRIFHHAKFTFFVKWIIYLAVMFPLTFLIFPDHMLFYLLAMGVWGLYFEFIGFAQFSFVKERLLVSEHLEAWSVLEVFKSLGITIAPILASYYFNFAENFAFYVVLFSWAIAWFISFILMKGKSGVAQAAKVESRREAKKKHGIKIWLIMLRKIWPVYLFYFSLVLFETSLYTVGPLHSEALREHHWLGSALISMYALPSLVVPFFLPLLGKRSKKRIAFLSAMIGGAILASAGFLFPNSVWFIAAMLLGSTFIAVDYPEIYAVFEDYVTRLDGYENDMVGLQSSAGSSAYILGPIVAGFAATYLGSGLTIGVFAAVMVVISVILMIVTPRKIRFSHAQLAQA